MIHQNSLRMSPWVARARQNIQERAILSLLLLLCSLLWLNCATDRRGHNRNYFGVKEATAFSKQRRVLLFWRWLVRFFYFV